MARYSGLIGLFWSILAVHFLYSCKVGSIKSLKPIVLSGAVQFYRIRAEFCPKRTEMRTWLRILSWMAAVIFFLIMQISRSGICAAGVAETASISLCTGGR